MVPSLKYVEEKFDYYNKLCFGGQLHRPPIRLNTRHGSLGITKCKMMRLNDGSIHYTDFSIEISVREDLPEEEYIDTIVHEMIHYYILSNDIQDDSKHGSIFQKIMHELSQKYGIRITIAYEPSDEELIHKIGSRWRYICVVAFKNGTFGIIVVAKTKLFEMWNAAYNSSDFISVKWYVSNRCIFSVFPVSVSLNPVRLERRRILSYLIGAYELERNGNCISVKK